MKKLDFQTIESIPELSQDLRSYIYICMELNFVANYGGT